ERRRAAVSIVRGTPRRHERHRPGAGTGDDTARTMVYDRARRPVLRSEAVTPRRSSAAPPHPGWPGGGRGPGPTRPARTAAATGWVSPAWSRAIAPGPPATRRARPAHPPPYVPAAISRAVPARPARARRRDDRWWRAPSPPSTASWR